MKRRVMAMMTVVVACACKSGPQVVSDLTPPTVPEENFAVVTQTLTQVDVKYTGQVAAGGLPIIVRQAKWEFVVDGVVKRVGQAPLNLSAAAGQQVPFSLSESLTYVKDEEELKAMDARGGSLLLALRGTLQVTVGAENPTTIEVPFARSKEVRTPRLPHLKLIDFDAGRFSENEVQATFHLGVVNPNPFQISLSGIDYSVQLSGKEVSKGTIGAGERVLPASTGVFDVTSTLNEETHGKDAGKIVKGLIVPYTLKSSLRAALYAESLDSKGDIRLKAAK